MKLGMQVGLSHIYIVLDGGTAPPKLLAHIRCGQMATWIKMPLGMEVGLGPGHFVLDLDPAPFPKGGLEANPKFSAHVYGQTAGWINIVLGTGVGLSPGRRLSVT